MNSKKQDLELNHCGLYLSPSCRSGDRAIKVNRRLRDDIATIGLSNLIDRVVNRGIFMQISAYAYSILVKSIKNLKVTIRNIAFVKKSLALDLVNKGMNFVIKFCKNDGSFMTIQQPKLLIRIFQLRRYNYTNA